MRPIRGCLSTVILTAVAMSSAPAQVRTDLGGDTLPPGAIARLGSAKFVHGERLIALTLSPDGSTAFAADDHHICLWDVATGRELREFKNIESVSCAAISPDGKLVAACENGPRVWIWDAKTGRELRKLVGKTGRSQTISWSADSKWIAAYADDRINLWDVATGDLLHRFNHKGWIRRIAISPDGKFLVTGEMNENFHRVWDIASEKELRRLPGSGRGLEHGFSPDGKSFVGYCEEKKGNIAHCSLRSWDLETGKTQRDIDHGGIGFAGFAPDGKTLCATRLNFIRVYDFASGAVLREWKAEVEVGRSSLSADGKVLAVDVAGRIRYWNPETGKELRPPAGHLAGVTSVSFAPNGKSVFSVSRDSTVRIWDWTSGRQIDRHHWKGLDHGTPAIQHRPDGTVAILDSWNSRVRVWNPAVDRVDGEREFGGSAKSFAVHPNGKAILTIGFSESIAEWTWDLKKENRSIKPIVKIAGDQSDNDLSSLSIAPDGDRIAWAAGYGGAGIVDYATGKPIAVFREYEDRPAVIEKVLFSPDGKSVASTGTHGHLQIWNSKSGRCTAEWPEASGQVLAYSPDGRFVAVAKTDIAIWDVAARKELIRFTGHRSKVNAITFEPRGRVLASASDDGTLLVWDLTGLIANPNLPKKAFTEREFAGVWEELKSSDPAAAQKAVVAIARGAPDSIALLEKCLVPVPATDPKRLAALVAELDDRDYRTREKASRALTALGEVAEPALFGALGSGSLEVRARAEALMLSLEKLEDSAERTRALRAVASLEYAGGPETRRLLKRYAEGDPGAYLTRVAKAAVERFARQEVAK